MFLSSLVDKLQLHALQLQYWLRSSVRAVFITGSDITFVELGVGVDDALV